jgi:hypothetical protein
LERAVVLFECTGARVADNGLGYSPELDASQATIDIKGIPNVSSIPLNGVVGSARVTGLHSTVEEPAMIEDAEALNITAGISAGVIAVEGLLVMKSGNRATMAALPSAVIRSCPEVTTGLRSGFDRCA